MINPTHKIKMLATQTSLPSYMRKPFWHVTEEHGWLGSGVTDCNGQEIFEGDRVIIYVGTDDDDAFTDVVCFKDGTFILKDCCDSLFGGANIEVVGHIATEEQP